MHTLKAYTVYSLYYNYPQFNILYHIINASYFAHVNSQQVVKGRYGMLVVKHVNNYTMKCKMKQKSM